MRYDGDEKLLQVLDAHILKISRSDPILLMPRTQPNRNYAPHPVNAEQAASYRPRR